MDARLKEINELSKEIEIKSNELRNQQIKDEYYEEIISYLDELSSCLAPCGIPIRISILDIDTKYTLSISPDEEELFKRYKLEVETSKNRNNEEIIIYYTLDNKFTLDKAMNYYKSKMKEENLVPLPITSEIKSFLCDNWAYIKDDLLDHTRKILEKKRNILDAKIDRGKKYAE